MTSLTELFEGYGYIGQEKKIYFVTLDMSELSGGDESIQVLGVFLEKHKAKKAQRFLVKTVMEELDADEEYEENFEWWNSAYQVNEVTTGLLSYNTRGQITNLLDNFKNQARA